MSLRVWCPFNGSIQDAGSYGTMVTSAGTPAYTTGKIRQSLIFNGVDTYVSILDPFDVEKNYFVCTFWCKPDSQSATLLAPQSYNNDHYIAYDFSQQAIIVSVCKSAGDSVRTWTTPIGSVPSQAWTFVAVSIIQNTLRIFINGLLCVSSIESVDIAPWVGPWIVGKKGSDPILYKGWLDELKLFDHSISRKEIKKASEALLLYFDFNYENSSVDLSGRSSLVTNHAAEWLPEGRLGIGCFRFDGSTSYFDIDPLYELYTQGTISLWIYKEDTAARSVFGSWDTITPQNCSWAIEFTATQTCKGSFHDGNTNSDITIESTSIHAVNTWVLYTFTFSPTGLRLYVNGELERTTVSPIAYLSTPTTLTLGKIGTSYFLGKIDDVRVYSTILTDTSIQELYQSRGQLDDEGNFFTYDLTERDSAAASPLDIHNTGQTYIKNMSESAITDSLCFWLPTAGSSADVTSRNELLVNTTTKSVYDSFYCYNFNGIDQYISFSPISLASSSPWSVALWLYIPSTSLSVWRNIISTGGSAYPSLAIHSTTSQLIFYQDYYEAQTYLWYTGLQIGTHIPCDTFCHVVMTSEPTSQRVTTLKVYVNSSLKSTAVFTWSSRTEDPVFTINNIGGSSSTRFFSGGIKDTRIFNKVLSPQEIQVLYDMINEVGITKMKLLEDTVYTKGKFGEVF